MKKIVLIFIIALQSSLAGIDIQKLESQITNSKYPDVMITLFNLSVHYYIQDDSIKLSKFAIMALNLADHNKDIKMKVDALNNLSFVISYRDHMKAFSFADEAYKLANKNSYPNGQCLALFLKGCSLENRDPENSLQYYYQSNKMAIKIDNMNIKAMSDAAIGDYLTSKGSYSNALKYYINAIKGFDKLIDLNTNLMNKYLYGELINNLGVNFKKSNNYEEAIRYYTKYKNISQELRNDWGSSVALNNLGVIFYNQKDYSSAISNFYEARNLFLKIGALSYLPTIDNNLGNIYSTLGDFKQSRECYDRALSHYKILKNDIGIARCMVNLGDLYLVMKSYRKSINMFNGALKIIKDKDLEIQTIANLGLSSVNDSLKKYSEAFKFFKIYSKLNDSLNNTTRSDEMTLLIQRYKDEKQNEENERLKQEDEKKQNEAKARKNNLEYMGILIVILFSFSFIFFYGKFAISPTRLESIVFIALLFLFTFISVMTDPFVEKITNNGPFFKLMINALLALALTPLDTYLEKIIRKKVINPNQ